MHSFYSHIVDVHWQVAHTEHALKRMFKFGHIMSSKIRIRLNIVLEVTVPITSCTFFTYTLLKHWSIGFRRIQHANFWKFGEKMGNFFKTTVFGEFFARPIREMPTVHAGPLDANFYFDQDTVRINRLRPRYHASKQLLKGVTVKQCCYAPQIPSALHRIFTGESRVTSKESQPAGIQSH